MKAVAALTLLAAVAFAQLKYPDIDVDAVFKNQSLYDEYFNCLMDKGPCSPQGQVIKDILPTYVGGDCEDCLPKQLEDLKEGVKLMLKKKPKDMEEFEKKWDPNQTLRKKYGS